MKRAVFVGSPFAAADDAGYALHRRYALACMRDSIQRGEAPFVPHLLWTQTLDDRIHAERELAMEMGTAWLARASLLALYTDLGTSAGMAQEQAFADRAGIKVEERALGDGWDK